MLTADLQETELKRCTFGQHGGAFVCQGGGSETSSQSEEGGNTPTFLERERELCQSTLFSLNILFIFCFPLDTS